MTPRTPDELRDHLLDKLDARRPRIELYEDYYAGRHRLAFATSKFREAFGTLFEAFADNWCGIVVDSSVERLSVEGFTFGEDTEADKLAWGIWQQNDLDLRSLSVHTEAVKNGVAYVMVDPVRGSETAPLITVEHPLWTIVEHAPEDRRIRTAALKTWMDHEGFIYATLITPQNVYKWRTETAGHYRFGSPGWIEREAPAPNPLGIVPVVPFENNPGLLCGGRSDLDDAIPLNDAINKFVSDMIVASEYMAFPQRVLTGVEVLTDDETGQPLAGDELRAAISRLWVFPDKDAKVQELGAADLGNYVRSIEKLIQDLAAITRTPPHYLMGQMVNVSGDALMVAEMGLISKVKNKQKSFGASWGEVMRLALQSVGQSRPAVAQPVWAKSEKQSLAQLGDALGKLRDIGVPLEALWQMLGTSPQEIEHWKVLANLPDRAASPGATLADAPAPPELSPPPA